MTRYDEFRISDRATLHDFMSTWPLATIAISQPGNIPAAITAPVIVIAENQAEFHVARSNPAFKALEREKTGLIIFHGPNAPVSPSFYKTRFENAPRSH